MTGDHLSPKQRSKDVKLILNSFLDSEEWDEARYDEVNFGDIPEELWKIFPSNERYIVEIMKFAGIVNREAILRLKSEKAVEEMFNYVVVREKLVEDKKAMFGIFAKDLSLLSIKPGLKPTFKRFITKVENLIPNRSKEAKRRAPDTPDKSVLPKAKVARQSMSTPSDEVKHTTADDLRTRQLKWLAKAVEKHGKEVSGEDQRESFLITSSVSDSFNFKCLQVNCFETFAIKYSSKSKSYNMYNIHRHITQSCWLSSSSKRKAKFSSSKPSKPTNYFGTSERKNAQGPSTAASAKKTIDLRLSTDRIFIPSDELDTDFDKIEEVKDHVTHKEVVSVAEDFEREAAPSTPSSPSQTPTLKTPATPEIPCAPPTPSLSQTPGLETRPTPATPSAPSTTSSLSQTPALETPSMPATPSAPSTLSSDSDLQEETSLNENTEENTSSKNL